jgi:cysteine synthase
MISKGKYIIDAIGNTPLLELKNIVPVNSARVIAKLKTTNPTGSMKDWMAKEVFDAAQRNQKVV